MNKILPVLAVIFLSTIVLARVHESWSYDELTKNADMIVIATPISTNETPERTTLPGIVSVNTNGVRSSIPAIGLETTFTNLSVLKGDSNMTTIVFHHLRRAERRHTINGAGLITFDPKEERRFLLFLKREEDGRFAPLTGQTDPDVGVIDLGTYP